MKDLSSEFRQHVEMAKVGTQHAVFVGRYPSTIRFEINS